MMSPRLEMSRCLEMSRYLGLRIGCVVMLLLGGGIALSCRPAGAQSDSQPNGGIPLPSADAPADPARAKLAGSIERRLGRLQPMGSKLKSPDDYYVLGTADLRLEDRHADVCFQKLQGQKATADFLAGYILEAPQKTLRQWHVFARLKADDQADQFLQFVRMQYDQVRDYRENVGRIYQAKTTRRC